MQEYFGNSHGGEVRRSEDEPNTQKNVQTNDNIWVNDLLELLKLTKKQEAQLSLR